jgi:carboxyl-terminal processing protease
MIDPHDVGDLAKKARPFDTVVLDLRGNPGGRQDVLQALLGEFLDHDVTIGELKGRNGTKPLIAKGRGKSAIGGKLIVLIDSDSASASEIFSRTVQLEKRGTVIGDHSSGAVMTSQSFVHAAQIDAINVTQYWSSITIEDVVLSNGERLEGLGVTPDEEIVPTPADVAAGRDPILARAAALAGVEMTPEKAGGMFPFKWPEAPIKIQ